jgi:hypothetical protein
MKAYVAIPYSDSTGSHAVGEEVTFDPKDKEGVNTLIDYGVLSKNPPESSDDQRKG